MTEQEEFEFRLRYEQEQAAPAPRNDAANRSEMFRRELMLPVERFKNLVMGGVRGAGSIGATLMAPQDVLEDSLEGTSGRNTQRRADIDAGLQSLGADPGSGFYQAGKLGAEVAGTAAVGPALGGAAKAAGAAPGVVSALSTGGFATGGKSVADLALRAGAGAAVGGASAGLVDPKQAATGAAIGGALAPAARVVGAAGQGIGRAMTGGGVAPEVAALAKRADQLGIKIPADRIANSKPLNAVAAGLNYVPFSGRAAVEQRMADQLDTALSRTFGQNSSNVTQALRKAQTDLGGKFDNVLKNNAVALDRPLLEGISEIQRSAAKELGQDGLRAIEGQIGELLEKGAAGQIDGQAAYNIKRTLDRIGKRTTPEAHHARELRKVLMEGLNRSLGPTEAAAFATTRKQYGNMLALENLAQNGAEGGISIGRLANMKNIGNSDLQELADIAAQFLKSREGNHGAAQRAFAGLGVGTVAGPAALAGGVVAGRGANALLDSNAARNMLMRQPGVNPLLGMAPLGRAAPVLLSDQ